MERPANTNNETTPSFTEPRILEYTEVVDTVQLSLARQLRVRGALAARSFEEAIAPLDNTEHAAVTAEIAERFDDELLYYVTCLLIARKNRSITIVAEEHEGFDGYLPWQEKLEQHIAAEAADGLSGAEVHIERYQAPINVSSITALGKAGLKEIAA